MGPQGGRPGGFQNPGGRGSQGKGGRRGNGRAAGCHVREDLTPDRLQLSPDIAGHPADVPALLVQDLMHQEVRVLDWCKVGETQALVDLRGDLGTEQEMSACWSWWYQGPRTGLPWGALRSSHAM